jgi:hypothetical protein
MAKTIYKYELQIQAGIQSLMMAQGANVVLVANQSERLTLWVEFTLNAPMITRQFLVFGTGHTIREDTRYVGSAIFANGNFVWHVYEVWE